MSEELLQRGLIKNPEKIGSWDFYNIGATSVKALKEYGIIRNVDYGTIENKKVDALIVQKKNVIAVIEYKKPSEFKTEAQKKKAIDQEIEVAQKLGAKIFIATDTQEAVWVNSLTKNRIGDESEKEIKVLFDPKNENIADLLKKIYESINEESDNIKPKNFVNPTNLAKSIWQDIWSVSGATPENCLYTFVELFIFKYLSDLGVLKTVNSFYFLMEMYEGGNTNDEILEYYANNVRPKIKELFPQDIQDKTTIINGTIFVSKDQKAVAGYSATFKTVLNKFLKYGKLENIDYDFKSQLFESFLKESISKKNWGQFFTPLKVIRPIIEMAKDDIKKGVKICDPACGVGKFLLEPLVTRLEDFYTIDKNGITSKISIHGFDKGFDKDEQKTIILAKANMLIYFSDLIKENPDHTKEFAKLFNESFTLKTNSILGTLSEPVENEYDLILTNPPYVTSGSGNLKDEIKKDGDLLNYYKINAMGVEGLFMEWIIKALKPGGKAFIVVPDGILNRQNDKNLRQYLLDECYIDGIISLPKNTFFTTSQKTSILAITKKINKKDTQTDPVFTYLVSEIGETRDINRFDIEQNDLQEAVTLYSFFKGNKKGFEKINSDKRCKIQQVEQFIKNCNTADSWSISKWWLLEEKILLGIEKQKDILKFEDFPNLIEEMKNLFDVKNFEYVKIKIKDIFDLSIKTNNSKFTKAFVNKHQGNIPVYSASKFSDAVDYGYVEEDLEEIKYFQDCLTWNIDGSIGKAHFRKAKFSLSEKVIPLIIKDHYQNELDIQFLKHTIENEFSKHAFDFGNKAGKGKIENIEILIPINKNKKIDIELQKEIAKRYEFIENAKLILKNELKKILDTHIKI